MKTQANLEGCIAAERAPERSENGCDQVARGASKYTPSNNGLHWTCSMTTRFMFRKALARCQ